jgi:hypothetical protein
MKNSALHNKYDLSLFRIVSPPNWVIKSIRGALKNKYSNSQNIEYPKDFTEMEYLWIQRFGKRALANLGSIKYYLDKRLNYEINFPVFYYRICMLLYRPGGPTLREITDANLFWLSRLKKEGRKCFYCRGRRGKYDQKTNAWIPCGKCGESGVAQ